MRVGTDSALALIPAYNSLMFLAVALLLTSPDILACHPHRHGKFTVSKDQWLYIHKALASLDSARVLKLIHLKHDLKIRVVVAAFPQEDGSIRVDHSVWNRAEIIQRLKPHSGFDINQPGYTYEVTSRLIPGKTSKYEEFRVKGPMLYVKSFTKPKGKQNASQRRLWRAIMRLEPIEYIKLAARDGRLWLDELSSGFPAE